MICEFEKTDTPEGKLQHWICPKCNTIRKCNNKPIGRQCGPDVQKSGPSLITKAVNLASAVVTAASDSFTQCSQAEVNERLAICAGCNKYDSEKNTCTGCGCSLGYKPTLRAWDCPDKKWPKLVRHPNKPVTVMLMTNGLHNIGGIERWIASLVKNLPAVSENKVIVGSVVVASNWELGTKLVGELQKYCRVLVAPTEGTNKQALEQSLRETDVVVVSGMGGNFKSLLEGYSGKVVWVCHSCCKYSYDYSREALETGLVTNWASVGSLAVDIFPQEIKPDVTVIENGVDVERCLPMKGRERQRAEWGFSDSDILIGYVGRLSKEKRPEALAEALKYLPSHIKGVVVGEGVDEDLIKQNMELEATGRIKYIPSKVMLGDCFAALDLGIIASPAEGFCLVRAEMQAAKLPLVSTPTGEVPALEEAHGPLTWVIEIGATGQEIANTILQALNSDQERDIRANRAQAIVLENYTSQAMAQRWVNYLQEII